MRHLLIGTSLLAFLALAAPAAAQAPVFPDCRGILFSTEEDFVSAIGERTDGNFVISDGDLLGWEPDTGDVMICARNAELLPPGTLVEVGQALGLDAVDAIAPEEGLIAFSTELDEQFGLFGHGDVLFPNGIVIPNAVLVARFQLPENMGLDALQFIGELDAIIEAIRMAEDLGRDALEEDPQTYLGRIQELGVDIWFSLEGTSDPTNDPDVLDGDLLSAVNGSIVAGNDALLGPPIPAGIIERGVDFGLDAVSTDREPNRESIRHSTEILHRGETRFTDGDVLELGGGIALTNEQLIAGFDPRTDFLGLDALSSVGIIIGSNPHIDSLCGRLFSAADFGSDGLWREGTAPPSMSPVPPRRPCGRSVPIDGTLPDDLQAEDGTIALFRVVYESITSPGFTGEVETSWRLRKPTGPAWSPCVWQPPSENLSTDGTDGWMNAQDFVDAYDGSATGITGDGTVGCSNGHLHLAVWDTHRLPADRQNDLMLVRLEWELTDGTVVPSDFAHLIQLDNKLPEMPVYPGGFEVRLMDDETRVPACGEAPTGESVFQVWADFADEYYWFFTLTVEGGDPPTTHTFDSPSGDNRHEYFESPDDATVPLKNTDDTGTIPDGSLVHLRNIDMTELGESFQRCCYLLELRVYDAAIRHTFNGFLPSSSLDLNDIRRITTFEAGA